MKETNANLLNQALNQDSDDAQQNAGAQPVLNQASNGANPPLQSAVTNQQVKQNIQVQPNVAQTSQQQVTQSQNNQVSNGQVQANAFPQVGGQNTNQVVNQQTMQVNAFPSVAVPNSGQVPVQQNVVPQQVVATNDVL